MTKEALAVFTASLVASSQKILVRKKELDEGKIQDLTLAFFDPRLFRKRSNNEDTS